MVSLNKVFVAGNLTKDPEVRFTPSGQAVGTLDLAINEYYLDKNNEKKSKTIFVNIVVWGKQAETAKSFLTKGSPILVEGRLQLDSWETKDGEKRSQIKINASRIQFLRGTAGVKNSGDLSDVSSQTQIDNISIDEDDDVPF